MTLGGQRKLSVWHVYLVWGLVVTLLYLLVPPFKGNGWMMPLLSMSSAAAIVIGTRMHRPGARRAWQLMALGQFLFACGDVYTYSYPALTHHDVPFPSIGDGIYLALYPALFGGMLLIARRRNPS
ncbi:MAG: diguanylate cyclase, partial [Gaiellales bacterium]|nr:diguanylate cyclase [Gaiellales bacterium]